MNTEQQVAELNRRMKIEELMRDEDCVILSMELFVGVYHQLKMHNVSTWDLEQCIKLKEYLRYLEEKTFAGIRMAKAQVLEAKAKKLNAETKILEASAKQEA